MKIIKRILTIDNSTLELEFSSIEYLDESKIKVVLCEKEIERTYVFKLIGTSCCVLLSLEEKIDGRVVSFSEYTVFNTPKDYNYLNYSFRYDLDGETVDKLDKQIGNCFYFTNYDIDVIFVADQSNVVIGEISISASEVQGQGFVAAVAIN